MTMQRWDPFGEMLTLRNAMDRLFEDAWVHPSRLTGQGGQQGGMHVPLDVYEQGDTMIIKASMPGVKPEDVNITCEGNTITIEGESRSEQQDQGQVHHQERRYGRFMRTVTLPTRVNADQANAQFEHGVLTLTLPKEESARAKRIPVGGGQSQTIEAPKASGEQGNQPNGHTAQTGNGATTPEQDKSKAATSRS